MSPVDISLLTAILAGTLSFLSPCVLPLVPPYLCYMAGVSVDRFRGTDVAAQPLRLSVLRPAFAFTLGFSTVFIALGAAASSLGGLLRQHLDILAIVAGIAIIIMGLNFLGVFRLPLLAREFRLSPAAKPATLAGAYIMGLAFAFGWTPCIGPVLGAILGLAAADATLGNGVLLLAAYSLGLAVPFWIAGAFSAGFMRFLTRFRQYLGTVEKAMGVLLVVTGIAFMTGWMERMAFWMLETFPAFQLVG